MKLELSNVSPTWKLDDVVKSVTLKISKSRVNYEVANMTAVKWI